MAVAQKRINPLNVVKDSLLNIILITSTLAIVLILTPLVLLYWLALLAIGNVKAIGYLSTGNRLLKTGKADMLKVDTAIQQLLGIDESGRKDSIAWVREKQRRSVANQLITLRRKSFPNEKIKYFN